MPVIPPGFRWEGFLGGIEGSTNAGRKSFVQFRLGKSNKRVQPRFRPVQIGVRLRGHALKVLARPLSDPATASSRLASSDLSLFAPCWCNSSGFELEER
jgi:hypothetical protein